MFISVVRSPLLSTAEGLPRGDASKPEDHSLT
jgi:hypothetical protein